MFTRLIMVAVLVLAAASPSSAAIITYTTRAAMELAQPADTFSTITFDGFANGIGYGNAAGLTIASVNFVGFTAASPPPYDLSVAASISGWGGGAAVENNNSSPTGTIVITLPANVFAVGADLFVIHTCGPCNENSNGFQVAINNGAVSNFTSGNSQVLPSSVFFGATSDSPIQTITFKVPAGTNTLELALDNFETGTVAAQTPEVATFLAIGSGLIGMRWLRRRVRHSRHARPAQAAARSAEYPPVAPACAPAPCL